MSESVEFLKEAGKQRNQVNGSTKKGQKSGIKKLFKQGVASKTSVKETLTDSEMTFNEKVPTKKAP